MSSGTKFTELNNLVKTNSGVFDSGLSKIFNYTDGAEIEQKLNSILSTVKDLSSNSAELEKNISDWPTEYHLSSTRANLLRGLDLSRITRVLELGCGCGSISRYIGEQEGIQLDAIEGSAIRASLAAKRCQDLPNVTISTGNFNQFEFPENYYDLVLYVGVTEYAGRFSERETDQEALQDLLALAKRSSKGDGVVLVAIENRTGLKYMMGASEDHYGIPYIGIDGYQNSTGIRTYTKEEWLAEISKAGYKFNRFVYPFPDYKVPTLMLHESCIANPVKVKQALNKIKSRDYCVDFDLGDSEKWLWNTIIEVEAIDKFSNSFMLLLSNDESKLIEIADFEVIEYQQILHNYRKKNPSFLTENDMQRQKFIEARQRLEKRVSSLKKDLLAMQNHADNLQNKIDLMTESRGWTALNRLRSLFGKN